jgi:hypothetical protein
MTQLAAPRVSAIADRLRAEWTGRRVVLLINRFDGATRALADELAACGATVGAMVSGVSGVSGGRFDQPGVPVWSCPEHGVRLRRRDFDGWLRQPPAELTAWLDGLDPARQWAVLGTSYTDVGEFCGRPVHGWWRPEWATWEDKTVVDQLWERVGVPAPPHAVLPLNAADLPQWVGRLDRGRGVVLAADTTGGILGSSKGLRWVRRPDELDAALRAFAGSTERVRVAAYLPGIPCSILGMVLPDGVAVFEPFEIVTLRRPDTAQLVYCGTSTWWHAPEAARVAVREHTRRVGDELARAADYRGMYSVDGILGEDGFFATELNPRHVSGLTLWAGWPQFPVRLFNRAVQERAGWLTATGVGYRDVEDAFCRTIRQHPAYVVRIPTGERPDRGVGSSIVCTPTEQTVSYRVEDGSAMILDVEPVDHDGAVGPAAAALAEILGGGRLVSYRDDSIRSRGLAPLDVST